MVDALVLFDLKISPLLWHYLTNQHKTVYGLSIMGGELYYCSLDTQCLMIAQKTPFVMPIFKNND